MDRFLACLAILGLLAVLPGAVAHGEHERTCDDPVGDGAWRHLVLWELELAPGEGAERVMAFEGCPLEEGWHVLARAEVDGTVEATLVQSGDAVGPTSLSGADAWATWTLPHTDFPALRLNNTGEANATVRVYFDQTCLCPVKGTRITPGPVWMNALAEAGDAVSFDVTLVPQAFAWNGTELETVTVHAEVFGDASTRQTWTFSPQEDPHCRGSARWTGCFTYTMTAPADGRQDVLLWLDHDGDDAAWALATRPVIEVTPSAGGAGVGAPAPGAAVLAGAVLAAAGSVLRRRAP